MWIPHGDLDMIDIRPDENFKGIIADQQKEIIALQKESLSYQAKYEQLKYELYQFSLTGMDAEYIQNLIERVCQD